MTTARPTGTTAKPTATTKANVATTAVTAATTLPPSGFDPKGVLRIGKDLVGTSGISLDPGSSNNVSDFEFMDALYDTMIHQNSDGKYAPGLAESWQVVDTRTIRVKLRSGLTFHDGNPVTATDVKSTVDRYKAALARTANNMNPRLAEISAVNVLSPAEFEVKMSSDSSGDALEMLAGREFMVQPAGRSAADANANPIGAGAFKFVSFERGRKLALTKFDKYYDNANIKLGGVDFVHVTTDSTANALLGGVVDMITVDPTQLITVQRNKQYKTVVFPSDSNFVYYGMCKAAGNVYADKRIRQALAYATNRDLINQAVYGGVSETMTQLWPKASPFYDAAIDQVYAYNPATARSLIQQATGKSSIDIRMMISSTIPSQNDIALLLQQQWADAGINVTGIVPTNDIVTDFFRGRKEQATISAWIRPGIQKVTRMFTDPASVANICAYQDPTVNSITAQIAAKDPSDPALAALWKQLDRYIAEEVLVLPLVWLPGIQSWDTKRVDGINQIYAPQFGVNLRTVFIKA